MNVKNPRTQKEPEDLHREQVVTNVLLPVFLTILVCTVGFVMLVLNIGSNAQSTTQWAEISTIFLIFPFLLIGLAVLIIFILLARLTHHWNILWPMPLRSFRKKTVHFLGTLQSITQRPAHWMIRMNSFRQGLRSLFKK